MSDVESPSAASDPEVAPRARPPLDDETSSRRGSVVLLQVVVTAIRFGPGLILLALIVVFSVLSPFFLTERNLQNLGAQSSIIAALAVGQLLVIVTRGVDVSVGSIVAFSAVIGATVLTPTSANGLVMIVVILAAGLAVGMVNGTLIVKGKLPQPLIVTVAMLGVVRGLTLIFSDGTPIVGLPEAVGTVGRDYVGPVPVPVVLVTAIAVVVWFVSTRTPWGRSVYAVGGNPDAARRLGLPVDRIIFVVYALSGLMAGLAGVITAGRTDSATPLAGTGLELDVISAVIIGGASLFGGRGSVPGVIVGALILGSIRNGLDLLDVEPFYQAVAVGLIVLVALQLDVVRGRVEERLRVIQSLMRPPSTGPAHA